MLARRFSLILLAALCSTSISCDNGTDLQGAGATFPAPLYKRWFLEFYKKTSKEAAADKTASPVRVNYQAIGSGAGIRQFTEGLVQFGASDAAMSDEELKKARDQLHTDILLLPMTAGSVAISYNIPGGPAKLQLSRDVLFGILFGRISNWNDDAIKSANGGAPFPDLPITFIRRAESSGTTFVFTNHLAAISKEWKDKVGAGKSVEWPKEASVVGAKGNDGVAALISQTPGSIGYIESGYAELTHLPMAFLENHAKKFVQPTPEASKAALESSLEEFEHSKTMRVWITDPKGPESYPIVTYTWLLCRKKYDDPQVSATLKEAIKFCLTEGQDYSVDLGYIRLPEKVAAKVLAAAATIEP